MSQGYYYYMIAYVLSDGRKATFNTFAKTVGDAIQDLYDNVPDISSGTITDSIAVTRRTVT